MGAENSSGEPKLSVPKPDKPSDTFTGTPPESPKTIPYCFPRDVPLKIFN